MKTQRKMAEHLAASWAQKLGLPFGNQWEPAIVRSINREVERLGGDASAWAFVEAMYCAQLGLDQEHP